MVSSSSGGTVFTDFAYPYPTDDSYVNLGRPNRNYGSYSRLYVKKCVDVRRSYLKFDLTVIDADKVIISAKLYLYCESASPSYDLQVDAHRTEDSWNEYDITWNNAPPVGALVSSTPVNGAYKYYSWDVTSYAQSEHSGDRVLSVVVKFPQDDSGSQEHLKRFASKETYKSSRRPYLEICYETPSFSVSISPPSVVMDVGQSQTFTSTVSGGTPPYSYQWYLDDSPVLGATNPTWAFTPTSPGSYEIYLNVTDNMGVTTKSNIASVTVNPTLTVSISPTSVVMDLGQSQTFLSAVSGGTPPYSYQWFLDDAVVPGATASSWTFTPASPGSYTVYVNVTDNVGVTAKSNIAPVTVNPALSVSITPTSITMDVGQSVTFTSSVSGGTSPFTYQWYLDDAPVPSAIGSTWAFTPTSSGSYTVYVNVTDNVGVTAKSNVASVTVNPALSVSISPTSVTMNLGDSKTFTSSVSGGTSPYSYQWYLDDVLVPGATSPSWIFTPSSPGSYEVYVNVTDNVGVTAKSNIASVTVNPALSVSISPTSAAMNLGDSKTFTSFVSGGTSPFTYQWYLDDSPVPGAIGSTWVFTPTTTGSYTVYLNVTDSVSATAKSNVASVTVNPPLDVSIAPTSVTMDVGQSVTFTSFVSGGTPPFTYQWYLDDAPVPSAVGSTWAFTPSSPGTYEVYLVVTDSSDPAESNHVIVTVNPSPTVSISPPSVVMDVGQSQAFTSFVSGGTSPYTYQWYLDDVPVPSATNPTWAFTPVSPGSYEVHLNVTDNVGVTAQSNIASVTVNPTPTVSINPTSVVMDVGQSVTFTSFVSGGTSPFTYQWYLDDVPVPGATGPSWTFIPSSPGSYEVYVNVTDNVGVTAKSNVASVTVNPALSVSISPMSVTMNVSESQLFTSFVSGGTSPYTYQWYLNETAVPSATSSSWMFTPMSSGYYLVYLKVTDDVSMSAESDTASVTVTGRPKAVFIYSPLYPYVNETVTFDASASTPNGGVISNYTWNFGDSNITTVTNPVITHVYSAEGDYLVTLTVKDSHGQEDSTSQMITVYLPQLYSLDHTAHNLGEEFLINVVVVNATNLYSFEFKLGYNTTLLDAIDVTEGSFLKSFGNTSATMEIHDSGGYIWISVTLLTPAPPAMGSGILATIRFKVTYETVYPETVGCSLDLYDTELNDPVGQPIPHTVHDGSYKFVPLPSPCIGPAIDVYTQRGGHGPNMPSDAFGPQEEVILYAYVSYNCEPVENKFVVFEVKNPSGETVLYRTATSNAEGIATTSFRIPWEGEEAESLFGEWTILGSVDIAEQIVNDTCTFEFGWLIEITQVKTVDAYGNPKASFTKGEHIYFNMTVKNIAFTTKTATLIMVVYDECGVPIGWVTLPDWMIGPGRTEIFTIDLLIPSWSYVGVETVYANAYTQLPELGGVPYCPETSTTFVIAKP